jgi:FtsP/CotA-like multicopper oxidase with cupredoxin domain
MERRDFLKFSAAGVSLPLLSITTGCRGNNSSIQQVLSEEYPDLQLFQPSQVTSQNGVLEYQMPIQMATPSVNGQSLDVRSYNGKFPPDTLVVKPGDEMKIHLVNNLPATAEDSYHPDNVNIPHGFNNINLHTHGLNVSPAADEDNVLIVIKPGEEFQYSIKIPADHPSGTFWYHPHKHGSALHQLASGMGGFLRIEGGNDDLRKIPEIAAATPVDLAFHELIVDPTTGRVPAEGNGEAEETPPNLTPDAEARNPIANLFKGTAQLLYTMNGLSIDDGSGGLPSSQKVAFIRMRPGEVQHWRLGMHCHLQSYRFVLEGHDLNIAGWDGITAQEMEIYPPDLDATEKLILGPANRVDILVKASMQPGTYAFKMVTEQFGETELIIDQYGNTIPLFQTPRVGLDELTVFNVIVEGEANDMPLPTQLTPPVERLPAITDDEIVRKRTVKFKVEGGVEFGPTGFVADTRKYYINHVQFDADRTNATMVLDTAEEWTIENPHHSNPDHPFPQINHPFHIHVNWFQLMELHHHDGQIEKFDGIENPVRWMDTIDVPFGGKAVIRHRFEKFTGRFVYHCHIIAHEDEGMMHLIEVVDGRPQTTLIKAGETGTLNSEDYSTMDPETKAWLEARHSLPPVKVSVEFEPDTFAGVGDYNASYQYKVGSGQAAETTDVPPDTHESGARIPGPDNILLDDPNVLPPPIQAPENTMRMAGLDRYFKLTTTTNTTQLQKPIKITIHYPKLLGHFNDGNGLTYDASTAKLFYSNGTEWVDDNLTLIEHDVDAAKLVYELSNDLGNGYFAVFGNRTGTFA